MIGLVGDADMGASVAQQRRPAHPTPPSNTRMRSWHRVCRHGRSAHAGWRPKLVTSTRWRPLLADSSDAPAGRCLSGLGQAPRWIRDRRCERGCGPALPGPVRPGWRQVTAGEAARQAPDPRPGQVETIARGMGGGSHQPHPGARIHRCGCSLPGLTGFTASRREGTGTIHHKETGRANRSKHCLAARPGSHHLGSNVRRRRRWTAARYTDQVCPWADRIQQSSERTND